MFFVIFFRKKRSYEAGYEIEVKNNLEKESQVFLVAPLPAQTKQQGLKSEIIFEPNNCQIKTDRVFGNQYVVWPFNLHAGETTLCRFLFMAEVAPIKTVLLKSFQLSDYGQQVKTDRTLFTPNRFIQYENEKIRTLARQVIGQEKNLKNILNRLNNFVISQLNYGQPIAGLYSAQEAWKNKTTDCGGFSSLLIALCLAVGIPARLVVGFWAGYNKNEMHAWVEIMLPNGQWLPADPAVEKLKQQGRTKKRGRLGFVANDRIIFSYGCDIPLEIGGQEKQADILQNPLVFPKNGSGSCSAKVEFKTL